MTRQLAQSPLVDLSKIDKSKAGYKDIIEFVEHNHLNRFWKEGWGEEIREYVDNYGKGREVARNILTDLSAFIPLKSWKVSAKGITVVWST